MQRQDTCTGEKCPFWFRYKTQCPNYVEGLWKTKEGDTYQTKDCAPKRTMILTQQLYDFMFGMRMDYADVRKATEKVLQVAGNSVGADLLVVDGELEETKLIEE
jgi:hypothetical protein